MFYEGGEMKFGYEIQRVKILQEYFRALIAGEKPFEIRKTDGMKIYEEGERLLLREIKEVVYFEEFRSIYRLKRFRF